MKEGRKRGCDGMGSGEIWRAQSLVRMEEQMEGGMRHVGRRSGGAGFWEAAMKVGLEFIGASNDGIFKVMCRVSGHDQDSWPGLTKLGEWSLGKCSGVYA